MNIEAIREYAESRWLLDDMHGLPHWDRVYQNGQRLRVTGVDMTVVNCFAYLHDLGREDNGYDVEHGPRSAEIAKTLRHTLLRELTDEQFDKLIKACRLHTTSRRTNDITIDTCFDADRLDLPRVHIIPHPDKMATWKGKQLAQEAQEAHQRKTMNRPRKIIYVDMDNVLVDFQSGIDAMSPEVLRDYGKGGKYGKVDKDGNPIGDNYDEIPGIFDVMRPLGQGVEAVRFLAQRFDVYILSTAPWKNPSAWSAKVKWVDRYLGDVCHKRLIISHHKNLCRGDYLIDDRPNNGAREFGEHPGSEWIQMGSSRFPDWDAILEYIMRKETQNGQQ